MATRLKGTRPRGRAGSLSASEKAALIGYFIEGMSVAEVYAHCLDNGMRPPSEHTLYALLNSAEVQKGLRERKAAENACRIARIAERTKIRQSLLDRIEATFEARGQEYAELAPGGGEGLVVLSDKKVVKVGENEWDTFNVYKTDTGLIEALRALLDSQEKADDALRRNLRTFQQIEQAGERHEQESELRELEALKRRAEAEALEAERKRSASRAYQPPTFPAVIVRELPNPNRPATIEEDGEEEDEGVTPEIPWILQEMED